MAFKYNNISSYSIEYELNFNSHFYLRKLNLLALPTRWLSSPDSSSPLKIVELHQLIFFLNFNIFKGLEESGDDNQCVGRASKFDFLR